MIVLYVFLGLMALLLLIAALLPKTYNVEKSIIIARPQSQVMGFVSNLHHYSQWNPWQQTDPTAKNKITGDSGQPGHKYSWEGKKVGVGSLTLNSLDAKHIHFTLEFIKPFASKAKDNWLFENWGDGETKVTWQNNGAFPFPVASLMGPIILKNLHKQFEQGLNNLKKMVEANG